MPSLRVKRILPWSARGSTESRRVSSTERSKQPIQNGNRHTHDICVRTFDSVDEPRGESLNGVCAGLVARLARGDVPRDRVIAQLDEAHAGDADVGDSAVALANGDTGQDVVSPARKLAQHRTGFRIIGRLAERLSLGQDNGICPDDHSVRMPRGHDCRLGLGEACHIRPRRFGWQPTLVDVGGLDIELEPCRGE